MHMENELNKSFWDEKYSTFDASEKVEGDLFLANKNIDLKNK